MIKLFMLILVAHINQANVAIADQKSCDWLRPMLTEKALDKWTIIPKTDYFEVVISQEASAMNAGLVENPFVPIDDVDAKRLTGFYYQSPKPKKAYLIRSVYGYGGNGEYAVFRRGNDLLIEHSSLGSEVNYRKSAIIVNLDFKPEQVFIVCSIGG